MPLAPTQYTYSGEEYTDYSSSYTNLESLNYGDVFGSDIQDLWNPPTHYPTTQCTDYPGQCRPAAGAMEPGTGDDRYYINNCNTATASSQCRGTTGLYNYTDSSMAGFTATPGVSMSQPTAWSAYYPPLRQSSYPALVSATHVGNGNNVSDGTNTTNHVVNVEYSKHSHNLTEPGEPI